MTKRLGHIITDTFESIEVGPDEDAPQNFVRAVEFAHARLDSSDRKRWMGEFGRMFKRIDSDLGQAVVDVVLDKYPDSDATMHILARFNAAKTESQLSTSDS